MDNGACSYRRFLDGDDTAIAELVGAYKDGLILYLNGYVHNIFVAEELAEDTFVRLCLKKPRDKKTGAFKTWLYTIGRNVAISHLRKASKTTTLPLDTLEYMADETGEPATAYLLEEQKRQIHRALEKLKPEYRQVLWLIYFDALSCKEAAKVMKKSVHATEVLVSRARQALKKELNGMEVPL